MTMLRALGVALALSLALVGCAGDRISGTVPLPEDVSSPTVSASPGATEAPTETLAALVLSWRAEGDEILLSVDPVEWLTGEAADEAARRDGEEGGAPNDFYILNDDKTPVEFVVDPGVVVSTVMDASGTYCEEMLCPGMPLKEWLAAIDGPEKEILLSTPYWLTRSGDVVTEIEQQYVP